MWNMRNLQKSANRVEHEAVDSLAGGEHYHGGAAVEGVARCHEVPAGLQSVLLTGLIICGLRETASVMSLLILLADSTS